jgi:ATP-dependent DNA helicase RecG
MSEFDTIASKKIEFLKGVGSVRAEALANELGIACFGELLYHFPFRYEDRSKLYSVVDISDEHTYVLLRGRITQLKEVGTGRTVRLTAQFSDESGTIELVWFKGVKWLSRSLVPGREYLVYGKPTQFKSRWNIAHPEVEAYDPQRLQSDNSFKGVYSSTEKLNAMGLHSAGISRLVDQVLPYFIGQINETLPFEIVYKMQLVSREDAMINVHRPRSNNLLQSALKRLRFEELFYLQLLLVARKRESTHDLAGVRFDRVGQYFNAFYTNHLGFELTGAQKRVIKEIRADVNTGRHMNRLIQGDVGSGKTIVALLSGLIAIDSGFQVALMAPTEILANQHYQGFSEALYPLGLRVELLTGSIKTAQRRSIHAGLESGDVHVLIGTHALIEPTVKFKNLGLAIIDEQHRFGVAQRARLWEKNTLAPHVLVMTATPIPRTLAMTVYGDLDVSVIDELPPGRKEIKTVHRKDEARLQVFDFLEYEISLGRQVYIVYPLIEESENMDYKDLMDGYESIVRRFPAPSYRVSIVHGKMRPEDKDFEMRQFVEGKSHILVATTVIEVGVNVPNASVMVIESAERFGLSQLHQLRGRVGRGAEQSYCILMTGEQLSADGRTRISTMCRTNDGFEIAEVDLDLRGPGDIMGTRQSGDIQLHVADLVRDRELMQAARHLAEEVLEHDPQLEREEHKIIAEQLARLSNQRADWSKIS